MRKRRHGGLADFERYWLSQLAASLSVWAGEKVRDQVIASSTSLSDRSERAAVIAWTQGAVTRLEARVDGATAQRVMLDCACQYPPGDLQGARRAYLNSRDIDRAHRILQAQFESFLTGVLGLDDGTVGEVISRGWGLAGVRDGNRILATKIPKSGYLVDYFREPDPERRRQIYCHCPRVRDALQHGAELPALYCYCGAGYYRGIWETILGQPVRVEVLESVLNGGQVCTVAIHLPREG
jgi:hypothetical protein